LRSKENYQRTPAFTPGKKISRNVLMVEPILFLTGHGDIPSTVRAMRDGAEDFLEKRAPKKKLFDAVTRALAREREARVRQRELRARFDTLSGREFEVLSHVVKGQLNKQIAGDLGIHERTAKLHRSAITTDATLIGSGPELSHGRTGSLTTTTALEPSSPGLIRTF
jgi:FixJ family two-component response regulator